MEGGSDNDLVLFDVLVDNEIPSNGGERGEGVLLLQSSLMDGLPDGECIEPIVVSNDLLVICTDVTRFHCDVLTEEL